MRRIFLLRAIRLAAAGILSPAAILDQHAKKVLRVAYALNFKQGPSAPRELAFRDELRKLG